MEAPGLLLWGLGRTKGKRGSGDEGGKWGRIQGKPAPVKSFNSEPANTRLAFILKTKSNGSSLKDRIKICE